MFVCLFFSITLFDGGHFPRWNCQLMFKFWLSTFSLFASNSKWQMRSNHLCYWCHKTIFSRFVSFTLSRVRISEPSKPNETGMRKIDLKSNDVDSFHFTIDNDVSGGEIGWFHLSLYEMAQQMVETRWMIMMKIISTE